MWKKGIRVIVSFAVVLLVWQIACTVTNANATLFPSPVKVGEEFVKLFTQGLEGSTSHVTLPGHIRISLLRFATGYVLAAVSAILLGLILGSLPLYFRRFLHRLQMHFAWRLEHPGFFWFQERW